MKVAIANDHNGIEVKEKLTNILKKYNFEIVDFGSKTEDSVDYPYYAFKVGKSVAKGDCTLGILICGTGIGMSIACNKVKGIRCAKVSSVDEAILSKQHNNANVIAISGKIPMWKMKRIVLTFLNTPFSNEERHVRRNGLIDKYDD